MSSPAAPATQTTDPRAQDESSFSPVEIRRIVTGLMLAIFLGALDSTIVTVALLTISRELGDVALLSWVVSAYLVASTVVAPIYGKLSDLYGRKRLLAIAIVITLIGSVLCALASTMPQLVLFRVIQGLGGGGLLSLSQATVADVAPGRERGRYQGYFSGTFALAAVAGPILGGYLTHYASWRAVFWVNLPIAVAALLLSHRALGRLPVQGRARPIDYPGALLLTAGLTAVMIALTRLGEGIPWHEPLTLGLIVASALLLLLFGGQERRAPDPIIAPALMTETTVVAGCTILALNFVVIVGASVLLPLAMQTLQQASADQVAFRMLPMTIGIPAGAFLSGRLMLREASFRRILRIGLALTVLACVAIAWTPWNFLFGQGVAMLLLGFGLGMPLPTTVVAVQSAVHPDMVGIATAISTFFRTLGGAIGIALLTALLLARLRDDSGASQNLQALLTDGAQDPGRLAAAFRDVFLYASLAALAALALTTLVRPPANQPEG